MGWSQLGHKDKGMIHAICLGPEAGNRQEKGQDSWTTHRPGRGGQGEMGAEAPACYLQDLHPRPRSSSVNNKRGKEGRVRSLVSD